MRNKKVKRLRKMAKAVAAANKLPLVEYNIINKKGTLKLIDKCFRSVFQKLKWDRV